MKAIKSPLAIVISLNLMFSPTIFATEAKIDWDVSAPTNASLKSIDINVNQGTWMNVSVSPDGEHVLFDLLGDIYSLEGNSSEAKKAYLIALKFYKDKNELAQVIQTKIDAIGK